MVSLFVDTSALYALLDVSDSEHHVAAGEWDRLRTEQLTLRTHNSVVLETAALLQRRLGMGAAADLLRHFAPVLSVRFVDRALHGHAMTSLLAADRRAVSLVDWTSFEMMRDERVTEAFAFDGHFAEQGFTLRPAG